MKEAIITVTFKMSNAWDETDTVETGLEPFEGVRQFLENEEFIVNLAEEVSWFGLELLTCEVSEINEQEVEK